MQSTYYTIGHSNHAVAAFVAILSAHRIDVVADVRSHPISRIAPHFNRDALKTYLRGSGIRYVFLGTELGGRPVDPDCYDADGYVLYSKVAESPRFLEGISRLMIGIGAYRVATMCSEENPTSCHRRLLIGRVMASRGACIWHLRGDGHAESEADVARSEEAKTPPSLFSKSESWKSRVPLRHKLRAAADRTI